MHFSDACCVTAGRGTQLGHTEQAHRVMLRGTLQRCKVSIRLGVGRTQVLVHRLDLEDRS